MKKIVFISLIIFSFVSSNNYAQKIGRIFLKANADSLFGKVVESASISRDQLQSVLMGTDNYAMFKIIKGELIILGDARKVLSPAERKVDDAQVFSLFSKSNVLSMLDVTDVKTVLVEQREKALTISYDWVILEMAQECPPYCM
jgi:hypothetical protein